MTDAVEVKLGADTGDAASQTEAVAQSIQASLAKISEALAKFTEQNKRSRDDAQKDTQSIAKAFEDMRARVGGAFDGITKTVERVRAVFLGLSAIVAGGMLWREAVESMLHLDAEVETLQRVMGMASDQATKFAVQLKMAGTNADTFTTIALHMGRQLKTNSEEFDRLGVVTKDAAGNFLPMEEIMRNVYERMQEFKAGTDQNMVALTLVGRSAREFGEGMENMERVQARAIQLQKDLGIEMGPERQAQIKRYKDEVAAFSVVMENMATKVGLEVMPRLQGLAAWMNDEGPRAASIAVNALRGLATIITLGDFALTKWAYTWAAAMAAIEAAVTGNFKRIVEIFVERNREIEREQERAAANLERIWQEHPLGKDVGRPVKSGSLGFTPKPTGPGADQSVMSFLEATLKAERDAYERMKLDQGSFEQWSVAQTAAYWKQILDIGNLSDKDRQEVLAKYYDAERAVRLQGFQAQIAQLEEEKQRFKFNYDERIRIAEQEAAMIAKAYGAGSAQAIEAERRVTEEKQKQTEQRIRLAEIEQRSQTATAKFAIEMAKMQADQDVAMRRLSVAQSLGLQRDFLRQETDLLRDETKKRIDIMAADPNADPTKLAELKAQLLLIEENYQKQLTAIDQAEEKERSKYAITAAETVQTQFADALAAVANRTKTVSQAFRDMCRSITSDVNNLIAKRFAEQLLGGGSAGGGFLNAIFGGMFGAASSASSGGFLYSLFSGGEAPIPSFDTGANYVPRDMLAIVHQGEAVVPKAFNTGNLSKGGMVQHVHFYNNGPIDTRTQDQLALAAGRYIGRSNYRNG